MTSVWVGSPNYSIGRTAKIDRIIIHWIVGNLSAADSTFQNTSIGTSAHYGVENTTVHQYVRDTDTAWHAGTAPMNARSIGIEHSAAPGRNATASTIDTSARLVADLCQKYKIPCDRAHIIRHSEVIPTECPGTIPIDTIITKANNYMKGAEVIADTDANYKLFNRLRQLVLGSGMTRTDFRKAYVGKSYRSRLEAIVTNSQAGKRQEELEKQLTSVQDALKQANAALEDAKLQYEITGELKKQLEASQATNDKLIAELEQLKAEKTDRDEAVNSLWQTIGDFLNKVLGR